MYVSIFTHVHAILHLHNLSFFCSKELKTLKVVRVKLDSGQRLIGLRYHEELIDIVEKLLKDKFPSNPKVHTYSLSSYDTADVRICNPNSLGSST